MSSLNLSKSLLVLPGFAKTKSPLAKKLQCNFSQSGIVTKIHWNTNCHTSATYGVSHNVYVHTRISNM